MVRYHKPEILWPVGMSSLQKPVIHAIYALIVTECFQVQNFQFNKKDLSNVDFDAMMWSWICMVVHMHCGTCSFALNCAFTVESKNFYRRKKIENKIAAVHTCRVPPAFLVLRPLICVFWAMCSKHTSSNKYVTYPARGEERSIWACISSFLEVQKVASVCKNPRWRPCHSVTLVPRRDWFLRQKFFE